MLESSENRYVDLGLVSYRGMPWWLGNDDGFLARHNMCLAGFRYDTPWTRFAKAQSMVRALGVKDRMPGPGCSPPGLKPACKLWAPVIWLQVLRS